jgi:predicted ABC-type ATPase
MFLPLAHAAAIYDNSLEPPVLIAEKESDSSFTVRDAQRWKSIEDATDERPHK